VFDEPLIVLFVKVRELSVDTTLLPPKVAVVASIFATNVPVEMDKLPVSEAVAVVVPTTNLSADSSQAIIALSPVDPLSMIIPESFAFVDAPEFNSNKLSSKVVLVELTVVVVPLTVKFPDTVKLSSTVTVPPAESIVRLPEDVSISLSPVTAT